MLLLSHNHLVLSIYSSYTTIKNPKVYRGPWAISAQYGLHTLTHKPSLDIVYFLNIHTTSSIILIVKSDIVKDFLNKYIKLSITCFYPTIQYILFVSYCKTAVFTLRIGKMNDCQLKGSNAKSTMSTAPFLPHSFNWSFLPIIHCSFANSIDRK